MRYYGNYVAIAALLCLLALSHPLHAQSTSVITETTRSNGSELRIRSIPDGADVTINGRFVGRTPLNVRDLAPGTHRIRIEKSGFVGVDRWVRLQEDSLLEMDVVLEQRFGILSLELHPDDADVYIDGLLRSGDTFRLPVAEYTLYVSRFGYQDYRERVSIKENRTTVQRIRLEPAPFALAEITVSQRRFNPGNPGPSGVLVVSFEVTAAGEATVLILSPDSEVVFQHQIPEFTERRQRVRWDGRSETGQPLPEGTYRIVVEGRDRTDQNAIRRVVEVDIDRSRIVTYRSTVQATGGALFAPDTLSLPAGNFQLSAGALAPVYTSDGTQSDFVPGHLGLRAGLGAGLELTLTADGFFGAPVDTSRMQAGVGMRWIYADPSWPSVTPANRFTGAVQLTGVFGRTSPGRANPRDVTGNWPGVRLGLPTGISFGQFRLVVTPELMVSVSHPDNGRGDDDDRIFWSYTRAALFFDRNDFAAALSGALRVRPFTGDPVSTPDSPDANPPQGLIRAYHVGLELHQILANTPLAVSLGVAGSFQSVDSWSLMIGGGLGIIY